MLVRFGAFRTHDVHFMPVSCDEKKVLHFDDDESRCTV